MENLFIEKTKASPEISFRADGNLMIRGVSNPGNVEKFYEPVFDWLNQFETIKPAHINLTLEIYYLNTSSTLVFCDILKMLCALKAEGSELKITWRYEEDDEDIIDLGEDLRLSSGCEFKFDAVV
jgi:hypothetical protein